METVQSFAMRGLAVTVAAALMGAAVGSHQLVLAASVTLVICATGLVIMIAIETWRERRPHSHGFAFDFTTFARRALAAWSWTAKSLAPFGAAVTARCWNDGAAIAARIRRFIDQRALR
jgi:hypothetical protein